MLSVAPVSLGAVPLVPQPVNNPNSPGFSKTAEEARAWVAEARSDGGPPRALKAIASAFLALIALSLTPAHADAVTDSPPLPVLSSHPSSSALPEGEQRYIVQYGSDVNAEAESNSLQERGIEVKETLSHTMKASVVVATSDEIETLKKSVHVASVELDTPVSITGSTSIWGLDRIDQRTGRDGQFAIGNEGAGVNVYVVDTGLYMSHSEFTGRVAASWTGISDGNGANDCNGHGTHVAGTVAGTTYGVAKKAAIIPVRVVECDGSGWNSTAIAGVDWAVAHHIAGQPAVMNLSIGGFTSASFDQAVQGAVNDGITVVAAAGNDGADACNSSPARIPSAITVAATDINDAQASWSNYGPCVDIQAPGVSVRSAWNNPSTDYNTLSGTSMATPHVSGAAAIMLSRDPALSPAQVHQSMINNATTGVISANKGATPNRLLFIPGTPPVPPSCSNLKPGDAWAGVGTHCGLQGSAASTFSITEDAPGPASAATPEVPAPEAPVTAPDAAPSISEDTPVSAPATTEDATAPAPSPAQQAPVRTDAPSQEVAATFAPLVPAAGNAAREAAAAKPEVISPEAMADEVTKEAETTPSETPSSTAMVIPPMSATSAASPGGVTSMTPVGGTYEGAPEVRAVTGANTPVWAITTGAFMSLIGGAAITGMVRRLAAARCQRSG
ncbi:serine protease [Pseudarthrobacter sp. AB1]|nr:serine protease [Pseudarthrobacter sp. AB1]